MAFGDADQTVNGIIVNVSGLVTRLNSFESNESDIGACFINAL